MIIPYHSFNIPDSKVHEANMGPIWGRQDPGGPHELFYLGLLADFFWRNRIPVYIQSLSEKN